MVTWNSRLLNEVNAAGIGTLKNQTGKDLVIFAGPDIVHSFMQHDLIDEFRLIANPLLLGSGKAYFKANQTTTPLKLSSVREFGCANALMIYKPTVA